ncbi:MAG TPA: archaeosortase/exosortase family protein, partial [Verrucomicrobiales bacterium]|nr:archaeosortase/exosortase family protein [Verrucomicrobiales bacterium]
MTRVLFAGVAVTLIFFYGFYKCHTGTPQTATAPRYSLLQWLDHSWNGGSIYDNSWLVVVVMVIYAIRGVLRMRNEPITVARGGTAWLLSGIVLWFLSVRVSQPFLAAVSLPLVLMGAIHFTCGWRRAGHAVLPLVLFAFVIPLPGEEKFTYWLGNHSDKLAQSFLQRLPDEWLSSFFLWSR